MMCAHPAAFPMQCLLPETSRAFLRHVYGCFYHDFSNMDVKGATFHWPLTLRSAAHAFLDAVLRFGMSFRKLFIARVHTPLPASAPEEAREAFPEVITVTTTGSFTLNSTFENAIKRIDADAEAYIKRNFPTPPADAQRARQAR